MIGGEPVTIHGGHYRLHFTGDVEPLQGRLVGHEHGLLLLEGAFGQEGGGRLFIVPTVALYYIEVLDEGDE